MKLIINITCCLLCIAGLNAQDTLTDKYYPLSNIELNYLYKDYDNKVAFSAPDNFDTIVVESSLPASIKCHRLNILTINFGHPGWNKVTLKVWGLIESDSTLISINKFQLRHLPEPSVYLDNVTISGHGAFKDGPLERFFDHKKLFSKYPPEIQLKDNFKVIEWTVTVGDSEFHGAGYEVSGEVCDAIFNSPKGTIVRINRVKVKSTYREFEIEIPLVMHKTSEIRTFRPIELKPILD